MLMKGKSCKTEIITFSLHSTFNIICILLHYNNNYTYLSPIVIKGNIIDFKRL